MKRAALPVAVSLLISGAFVLTASAQEDDIDRTPEKCIVVRDIDRTDVVDDRNILFYMRGGKIYRNYLPRACPSLAREERFMYRTSIGRLCDVDWVEVLYSFGSGLDRGPSCGLGNFYQISEEEAKILKAGPKDVLKEPEKVEIDNEEEG